MAFKRGERQFFKHTYDFSRDGGAQGAISLPAAPNSLEAELRVIGYYIVVEEDLASAGSPTLTFGNTGDADGYAADCYSLLSSGEKAIMPGEVAGDLVWDDTNDHLKMYRLTGTNDLDVVMTIGTADLTAGKLSVYLECIAP